MAPSVLEDMYKSQIIKSRSPRKFGTTPRTHFGHLVHGLGNSSSGSSGGGGGGIGGNIGPHSSHLGHFNYAAHPNNFSEEMMEIGTGMPPV